MKLQSLNSLFAIATQKLNQNLHFGEKSIKLAKNSFFHPLQSQFCVGIRENTSLLNTQQTIKLFLRAFHVLSLVLQKKGRVLIINTNPELFKLFNNLSQLTLQGNLENSKKTKAHIQEQSRFYQTPLLSYVSYKWVGGTLTNWKQISKSVLTFAKFSQRCEKFLYKHSIDFPKYTRVKKSFQGLISQKNHEFFLAFTQKPDLIFIVNPHENSTLINEASRLHILVIAFMSPATNPQGITYPIPVNNFSINFLYYCLKKIIKMTKI